MSKKQEVKEKDWTVIELLKWTTDFLNKRGFPQARLEAEILLASILEFKRIELYVNFDLLVKTVELKKYREIIKRRVSFEPVAYILGKKEFYGLNFEVSSDVLIPRPETELLVDEVLSSFKTSIEANLKIADIGVGSGAIGGALLANFPQAHLWAVDISPQALKIAAKNFDQLELSSRVSLFLGDLLTPLLGHKFDIICANLPYIPEKEMKTLMPDVALFEPHLALNGGEYGLDLIIPLLKNSLSYLVEGGLIFLEIWPDSWERLKEIARNFGFKNLKICQDLDGHNRIAVLSKN